MGQIIFIAVVAGAAVAVMLFAALASGSLIPVVLFYLAPLPIMIAVLGWHQIAGIIAALVAAAGLSGLVDFWLAGTFLLAVGLPAWWLGYLALLVRQTDSAGSDGVEWYPVGRLVVWSALMGTLAVAVAVPHFGFDADAFREGLRHTFEALIRLQHDGTDPASHDLVAPSEESRLLDVLVLVIPPASAALSTITNVFNLWLAGRIVRFSGQLKRPWPVLSDMTLPSLLPAVLALAIGGAFMTNLVGILSGVLAASLFMAYALLGFAVLHTVTRGHNARSFLLAGTYGAVFMFGWPLLVIAAVGLADATLGIRARLGRAHGPP
jgi:hypothetical protein